MPNPKHNKDLHYKYWISILVTAVILISTYKVGGNSEINQLLSFALTLSSLVLAVLAIFLSISSSITLERTSEKINSSSHDIKESSSKISNALSMIKRVEKGVDIVKRKFEDYEKTGEHERKQRKENTLNSTKAVNLQSIDDSFVDNFLDASTPRGCDVLLIATLSHRYSTPFTFHETLGDESDSYALGFLKAAEAAGLLSIKNNNHHQMVVSSINNRVTEIAEEKVIEKNNESYTFFLDEDNSPDSVLHLVYNDYINIFKYFNAISEAQEPRIRSLEL